MDYPTIRFFPPNTTPNYIGTDFDKSFNIQKMKNNLINKLRETQSNGNLTFLCDLLPYERNNIVLESNYILAYVIIDTPENYLAQELVIDFCPVKKVKIIYVLNSNTVLVKQLNADKYPSLYRIQNNNQFTFLASGNDKNHFIEIINAELESAHITPFSIIDITTKLYNMLFQSGHVQLNDTNIIYLSDLEATLKYSLDHELTSRSVISGDALDALKSYLELLVEYFPTTMRGKKFIKLVLEHIQNNKSVSGAELKNFVDKYELLLNPYVTKQKWIGCEGSRAMYRRYPCGLWTLFHTLTVQASTKQLNSFNGAQVLTAIAGYVKYFFGCTDCSTHFMQMAESIKDNVTSFDEAVLWLWSAHNQVNERLAGDVTEDPIYPKVLFPLKVNCESCRKNSSDVWNKTEVLKYLKTLYSTISIKQTSNDNVHYETQNLISSQLIIDDNNNYNVFDEEQWKIDVSTCMISYILSCSVLMILFYLLVVKKRCKKSKYINFIQGKV